MTFISNVSKFAAGTALGLALLSGAAVAQDMMADEDTAAELQQDIMQMPQYSSGSNVANIMVKAEEGKYVITGFVTSLEQRNEIDDLITEKGLDMDQVDNRLVME